MNTDSESDIGTDDVLDAAGVLVVERVDGMNSDGVYAVEDDWIAFEAKLIPAEDRVPTNESIN